MTTSKSSSYVIRMIDLSLSHSSSFSFYFSFLRGTKNSQDWLSLGQFASHNQSLWPGRWNDAEHPSWDHMPTSRLEWGWQTTWIASGGLVSSQRKIRDCCQREEQWKKDWQKLQRLTTPARTQQCNDGGSQLRDPVLSLKKAQLHPQGCPQGMTPSGLGNHT